MYERSIWWFMVTWIRGAIHSAFSAYLAVSINYTKAFKAKNKIINIIEQNEGMSKSVGDVRNKTDEELNKGKLLKIRYITT